MHFLRILICSGVCSTLEPCLYTAGIVALSRVVVDAYEETGADSLIRAWCGGVALFFSTMYVSTVLSCDGGVSINNEYGENNSGFCFGCACPALLRIGVCSVLQGGYLNGRASAKRSCLPCVLSTKYQCCNCIG